MKKQDLIDALTKKTGSKKKEAEQFLSAFTETVSESLKAGEKVALIGFGTFGVKKRAGRTGVNPRTRAKIQIPATTVPFFKAGETLKKAVK